MKTKQEIEDKIAEYDKSIKQLAETSRLRLPAEVANDCLSAIVKLDDKISVLKWVLDETPVKAESNGAKIG